MKLLHAKSPCCRSTIWRKGGRRRICSKCKKTWRIRLKHRGRKKKRIYIPTFQKIVSLHESLRSASDRLGIPRTTLQDRLPKYVDTITRSPIPQGPYILIVDGMWWKEYVVYLILVRPVCSIQATILDPVMYKGKELGRTWKEVFDALPKHIHSNVVALVADGLVGLDSYANKHGWTFQRCHFHFLASLYRFRGRKLNKMKGTHMIREHVFQLVREALRTRDMKRLKDINTRLFALREQPDIPKWIAIRIRGYFIHYQHLHAYRDCPQYNIPTTTNSSECLIRQLRELIALKRGFYTTESFLKWITAKIRLMKTIRCNGPR